jgi:hypothetical protein
MTNTMPTAKTETGRKIVAQLTAGSSAADLELAAVELVASLESSDPKDAIRGQVKLTRAGHKTAGVLAASLITHRALFV